jgi:thioredoxin-related protein
MITINSNGKRRSLAPAVLAAILALAGSLHADDVRWRSDYNIARREAIEKDRPLILDFVTQNCFWCKKLDASTFRDPTIVTVLNDRFIPLKVDAEKDPLLAQALRVNLYPTLVLASADGKILGTLEGFVTPDKLIDHLQRALASVSNPEWMSRDYQEAVKAVAGADYTRAVALLKNVVQDRKERPVQIKARQLLVDIEQQAASRLARAKKLEDKGQAIEAMDVLTELLRSFPGTQAATDGGHLLTTLTANPDVKVQQRSRRARELLGQAREEFRTQQYLCCIDHCEVLMSAYADLPEGTEALQLANEIKANPEWLRAACDTLSDRLADMYLALAETCVKKGQAQQATQCLERVMALSPGSRQAEMAQVRLSQIQGRSTQAVEFKKP